ncbi:MAG: DUF4243 domain-containing protein [Burkholderiales bacterium]|nr:DUF4243 domain-containing protein [Burkholderiales bacterium]
MDDTLQTLLNEQLTLPPEYHNGLSSHLPMALHALHALGAGPSRLRAFYGSDAARFQGRRAAPPAPPPADWLALRGQIDAFPALQAHFARAIARDGTDLTLHAAVHVLIPGVAAAALHGAIRTAHAVEAGHAGELAAALAYWAACWSALPPVRAATGGEPFDRWTERLQLTGDQWQPGPGLISAGMRLAAETTAWQELVAAPSLPPDPLAALARFAAARYAATRNFTVLHLVTGCRALQVLAPWCDAQVVAHALRAYVAAYLASGVGSRHTQPRLAPPDWPTLHAGAIASDDDHIVKLVHAATDWAARCGGDDGPWRAAAATALAARSA